jgi:FkbM family methyltransferase
LEQERFCQQYLAISPSDSGIHNNSSMTATVTVHKDTSGYGGSRFAMQIYASRDIVSDSLRRGNDMWDPSKTVSLIQMVQAAARGRSLSDLVFLDIGANVGWFTLVMASIGLRVIAIEPMLTNLHMLRQSLCLPENRELASRVILHGKGVSNETRSCLLYSDLGNYGDGVLHCGDRANFVPPPRHFVRGPVDVLPLDDLVQAVGDEGGPTIIAVKMDTEGHEALVLQGGPKLFLESQIPLVFSEFHAGWIEERGGDPLQFVQSFLVAGYTVRKEAGPVLTPEYVLAMDHWTGLNDIILEYQ